MMSVMLLNSVCRSVVERASLKCRGGHENVQSSKVAQLVESRALGELGVVKLLASHLRSLPGYKKCNLLSCI